MWRSIVLIFNQCSRMIVHPPSFPFIPPWTPSIFNKCSSLAIALMMLQFWENVVHLLNYFSLKFATNPMMDLRGTIILIKNPKANSWKSFHELHYNYLLHTTSFHALLFAHIFLHEQHFFTHNNYFSIHTFILLLFLRKTKNSKNSFPPSFSWPVLELVLLVQWKLWKILPSNQWPPYLSWTNENRELFTFQSPYVIIDYSRLYYHKLFVPILLVVIGVY